MTAEQIRTRIWLKFQWEESLADRIDLNDRREWNDISNALRRKEEHIDRAQALADLLAWIDNPKDEWSNDELAKAIEQNRNRAF